jgi:hypothetical protein
VITKNLQQSPIIGDVEDIKHNLLRVKLAGIFHDSSSPLPSETTAAAMVLTSPCKINREV